MHVNSPKRNWPLVEAVMHARFLEFDRMLAEYATLVRDALPMFVVGPWTADSDATADRRIGGSAGSDATADRQIGGSAGSDATADRRIGGPVDHIVRMAECEAHTFRLYYEVLDHARFMRGAFEDASSVRLVRTASFAQYVSDVEGLADKIEHFMETLESYARLTIS